MIPSGESLPPLRGRLGVGKIIFKTHPCPSQEGISFECYFTFYTLGSLRLFLCVLCG